MAPMVGFGGILIPPPPSGMSARGLHQREERLRRLGFMLHRMQVRALTAERHKVIEQSYPIVSNTPKRPSSDELLAPVVPLKSSPERQERVQEYLRRRYARPVSCTPAEIRSHYAGIFESDSNSESCINRFNELGVPKEFPAFYGVHCERPNLVLDTQDSCVSPVSPTELSVELRLSQRDTESMATATNLGEFDFAAIRQRCNEKIQARIERRLFTQLSS
ncbi:Hypothetical protein GLP15_3389 [Giardia lamblia P15]|uniref:Uncharacterized protein n=1 Tax=Giardia intestinalis (strain P15) TaxID=658858 RepID=E1EVY5_GIAIA|nr:Hypothetical protein GLP15_3389 [Giardia lamblia P15]